MWPVSKNEKNIRSIILRMRSKVVNAKKNDVRSLFVNLLIHI